MINHNWTRGVWQALLLLLLIAIGARVVYGLLAPLLPVLGAVVVLIVVYVLLISRRR